MISQAWNVANGNLIQSFETKSDSEITGLNLIDRKRLMIAVGTNKKIISFLNLKFEVFKFKKKFKQNSKMFYFI